MEDHQMAYLKELQKEHHRFREALEKIAKMEPGVSTGGLAAWIAAEALKDASERKA